MSLDNQVTSNLVDKSPEGGDFIGPPNIRSQINEILNVNQDDYDEQIVELISMKHPGAGTGFQERDSGGIVKSFGIRKYIRLLDKGNKHFSIDMIEMPSDGTQAMLEIFAYCVENGCLKLTGKIQPQKKCSERRKKVLMDLWNNFGFSNLDGTNIELFFSPENKRVLVNKIKYYLENGKWFKS